MKKVRIAPDLQKWIDARQRFRLSHAQIQMARELGLNPAKFGRPANHGEEPWKTPLPQYIERLYFQHYGKEMPESVLSIEDRAAKIAAARIAAKKEERREAKPKLRQPSAEKHTQ